MGVLFQPSLGFRGPSAAILRLTHHGLGKWSDQDIKNAITKGIRPDGTKLTGPMPFDRYARMTPGNLDAIVAYVWMIKPVKNE